MRALLVVVLLAAAGCLGPPSAALDESPAGPKLGAPDDAAQPSHQDRPQMEGPWSPTFRATSGSISIEGGPPHAVGEISRHDGAEFTLDGEGAAELSFLEPETAYSISLAGANHSVMTRQLAWTFSTDEGALIQPGWTFANACTLAAILRDATYDRLYGVLVAHCADGVGDEVTLQQGDGGHTIGTVVSHTYDAAAASDGGLVFEINPAFYSQVNPQIYAVGGPTGIGGAALDLVAGERLCFYGHGYDGEGFVIQELLRARCGEYTGSGANSGYGNETFGIKARADGGDSGAAVVDRNGTWHGLLVTAIRHDSVMAMSTCMVFHDARADGLDLALVSAPYTGFEPAPYNNGSTGVWTTAVHGVLADGDGPCARLAA